MTHQNFSISFKFILYIYIYFLFFLFFSLPSLFTNYNEKREDKKNKKVNKMILKAHRNFNNDIISIMEKISTRQVHQHRKRLQTVNGVGQMNRLKVSGLTCHYCYWIHLVEIFLIVPVVLSSKFCVSIGFFFSLSCLLVKSFDFQIVQFKKVIYDT